MKTFFYVLVIGRICICIAIQSIIILFASCTHINVEGKVHPGMGVV